MQQKTRHGHICFTLRNTIYVHGGLIPNLQPNNGHNDSQHLLKYDDTASKWVHATSEGSPSLNFHSGVTFGQNEAYIFGGRMGRTGVNCEVFKFDSGGNNNWSIVNPKSDFKPFALYAHCAARIGDEMFVFGGMDEFGFISDAMFAFDLIKHSWRKVELSGDPIPACYHATMSAIDQYLIVFGGRTLNGVILNTMFSVNVDTCACSVITMDRKLTERYGHVNFIDIHGYLHILGGHSRSGDLFVDNPVLQVDLARNTAVHIEVEANDHVLFSREKQVYPRYCTVAVTTTGIVLYGGCNFEALVEPPSQRAVTTEPIPDYLLTIPEDVSMCILAYLCRSDLCSVAQVSKGWEFSNLANHDRFWEPIFYSVCHDERYAKASQCLSISKNSPYKYKQSLIGLKACYEQYTRDQVKDRKAKIQKISLQKSYSYGYFSYAGKRRLSKINLQEAIIPDLFKVVVVGVGAVGKTSFINRIAYDYYYTDYCPAIPESPIIISTIGDKSIEFYLWDTAGQEDYDRLRPLTYPDTNLFVLCFSLINPDSMDAVVEKFIPEIHNYMQLYGKRSACPILLMGTKHDLRTDPETLRLCATKNITVISEEMGELLARRINCVAYHETSAKEKTGISPELFPLFAQCYSYFQQENANYKKKNCVVC